jgi:hypothetical protein
MRHQKSQIEAGLVTPLPLKVEQVGKGNMVVPRPLAIRRSDGRILAIMIS